MKGNTQKTKADNGRKPESKPFTRNNKKRSALKQSKRTSRPTSLRGAADNSNDILERATRETPTNGKSSLVFPGDSAAMTSFGNMITSPGQNNFIKDFNIVRGATSERPFTMTFTNEAMRTANVCVVKFMPYFGAIGADGPSWTSPVLMAALNLKQYIDTSFGTRYNYDPQDLATYLMAVSSVFPMIAEIKRDLRLTLAYVSDQYPQFVPQGLFAALEIADDAGHYNKGEGALYTAQHMRGWIDKFNQIIVTFNRLPMPPQITAFGYNDDLFDHVFTDTEDIRTAQMYVFQTAGYWIYNETQSEDVGSALFPVYTSGAHLTVEQKIARLEAVVTTLTSLRSSSSAMLQNLFNAFGSRDVVQVPTLEYTDMTPLDIVYDPNICTMIDNMQFSTHYFPSIIEATASGELRGNVGWAFAEDEDPSVMATEAARLMPNIPLQFHKPASEVTHDDIGWALRMHPIFLDVGQHTVRMGSDTQASAHKGIWATHYMGFAIPHSLTVVRLTEEANTPYEKATYEDRRANGTVEYALLDFKAHPAMVQAAAMVGQGGEINIYVERYFSARDVELTYRLEDIEMHWLYLTMSQWGSNVNLNVIGSRQR